MPTAWPRDLEGIVEALVAAHPVLEPILEENTMEDGDVLCTLFFGFLQTEILDQLKAGALDPELAAVLPDLEDAFATADARAQNEIAVGFLEYLPEAAAPGGEINALLGPRLAADLRAMRDWVPTVHWTDRGRRALGAADIARARGEASIEEEAWWTIMADWSVHEVATRGSTAAVRGLLADLESEVAREDSRGREFILNWFVPRLLAADGPGAAIKSMLGPNLLAGR